MARKITLDQLQKRLNTAVDKHLKDNDLKDAETRHIVLAVLMSEGATDAMCLLVCRERGYDKTLRQEIRWSRNRGREYPGTDIPTNEEAMAKELELTGSNVDWDGGQRQARTDTGSSGSGQQRQPREQQTSGKSGNAADSTAIKAAKKAKETLANVEATTDVKEARKLAGQVKMHAGRCRKAAEASEDAKDQRAAKAMQGLINKAEKHVKALEDAAKVGSGTGGGDDIDPDEIDF